MNKKIKVSAIQFNVIAGQVDVNLKTVLTLLNGIEGKGIQLAVLPEMFSCSFDNDHLDSHVQKSFDIIEALQLWSRRNSTAVAGTLPRMVDGRIYNAMVFIDTDGEIKGWYHKLHLFPLIGEDKVFTAGNRVVTLDTSIGRIGLMTCYDLRFPELCRAMCLEGARMIILSAQWPAVRIEHWKTLIRARAVENQLFLIGANRTGTEGELTFPGGSMIAGPDGAVLALADGEPCVVSSLLDMNDIDTIRKQIPCITDRRADIYG